MNPGVSDYVLMPHVEKWLNKTFGSISKSTYAESIKYNKITGITVNDKIGDKLVDIEKRIQKDVASKFHPEGCGTLKAIVEHELGHQFDEMLGISKEKEIIKLYSSMTGKEITEKLSTYSWRNSNKNPIEEFVAEAWSEYCNNTNPRDIATQIGKLIERRYKEWK